MEDNEEVHWPRSTARPAIKSSIVVEAVVEHQVESEPLATVKGPRGFVHSAEAIHAAKNIGSGNAVELATYVA